MSLRRFMGWEPTQTHTTTRIWRIFGWPVWTRVTVTTVTTEPEWDEPTRQGAYALQQELADRCPECGGPRVDCADPDIAYYPQLHRCYATAARQRSVRLWERKNKDAKPDTAGYMPDDGTTVWVSRFDLTPDDDFID